MYNVVYYMSFLQSSYKVLKRLHTQNKKTGKQAFFLFPDFCDIHLNIIVHRFLSA